MTASTIVSGVNMIVLGIMISIFFKIYSKTKAQLPLGLIIFAGFLVLHNVLGVVAYFSMTELYSMALLPYLLGVHSAELVGLLIFLKITLD
ncbi:MAG TPA: hypothetical protein VLD38_09170 [Nitrosopumilaceae archaeon]|nr:hypothetical protein [Nitrosopumilaceae archaeon]